MRIARTAAARLAWLACTLAAVAITGACSSSKPPAPGTPVLTMSTTNARFAAYIVNIGPITLSGPNGAYATLQGPVEPVDLTRLTDIGELVEAPAIPTGTFTSATLNIDYSTASIWVNNAGTAVQVTPVLPNSSTGIVSAILPMIFDPAKPLVVPHGTSTRVHFNMDLDAFNSIDLTTKQVTVQTYAVMNSPPPDSRPLRARGLFVLVQDGTFTMNLRPFFDLQSALGALIVYPNAQTYYNINGITFVGADGLAAMKDMPINTSIVAFGVLSGLSGVTPSFTPTTVLVGTSAESPLQDHLLGVVAQRTGNTMIINGGQFLSTTFGTTTYLGSATVNVGAATIVSRDGVADANLSPQSISVGQMIDVAGVTTYGSTGYVTLDATAGQVRLTNTRAWGRITASGSTAVTLNLLQLGPFAPSGYNFAGTATGGGAVDPSGYLADTGSTNTTAYPLNTLLALDGVVAPFGAAPPDFFATNVTPGSQAEQLLVVEWVNGGSATPFDTINDNEIVVNLSNPNLGGAHLIYTGPDELDLKDLPSSPPITTVGAGGPLLLTVGGVSASGVSEYESAAPFTTKLSNTFSTGTTNRAYKLVAVGHYNPTNNTFVATRINVALQNPATS